MFRSPSPSFRFHTLHLCLLLLWVGGVSAVQAQEGLRIGLRLGTFEPAAQDSYDAVYGDTLNPLGLQVEWGVSRSFLLVGSFDYSSADGELAVLLPDGTVVSTGFDTELTLAPLHLTAAWQYGSGDPWTFYAGGGPTLLRWEENNDLEDTSETDFGAHLRTGVRYSWDRFAVGGELLWSTVPDVLPEDGIAGAFDEDDLGGLGLSVVGTWRLW